MREVLNAGSPQTNSVVLGTALHRECIVCQLQRTPGWQTHLFRSIIEWPQRIDLWQQSEAVSQCHDDPHAEEGTTFGIAEGHCSLSQRVDCADWVG
jgi:hypothetical protein